MSMGLCPTLVAGQGRLDQREKPWDSPYRAIWGNPPGAGQSIYPYF